MRSSTSARLAFWLPIGFLVLSIVSVRAVPRLEIAGADLHNLYVYHHCPMRDDPYLATGTSCGDLWGRDMFYPPLLYWSFVWTRFVSFPVAFVVWSAFTVLAMLLAARAWIATAGDRGTYLFWLLLLAQFPLLFALERGNNDVVVVLGWSLAFLLLARGRVGLSGVLAGSCAALKLYPAIAVAAVAAGLWRFEPTARRRCLRFAGGAGLALVLAAAALPADTRAYVTDELPRFANDPAPDAWSYSHAMPILVPGHPAVGLALSAAVVALWVFVGMRRLATDPGPVFAGAIAMSTYFASISWDYNLITTYPLLLLLFDRSREHPFGRAWLLLALGLVAIVGDRTLFDGPVLARVHVLLELAWLALTALHFLRATQDRPPAADPGSLT